MTPTKLGHWIVENFDPDKCIIRMNDGRAILITPKMINEMIEIPMGTMAVMRVPTATTEFPLIVDWRKTYAYANERFTIKSVVERLLFEHQSGREFKINFLVMFFSIIGDCPKMGTVNQRFLPCIEKEEDIKNMDWCTYLMGTIKKTMREYKQSQGFGGPLLLMVLKPREKEELKIGGFGMLPIIEAYQYVEQQRKQRLTKGAIRLMKKSPAKELGYNQGDIIRHDMEIGIKNNLTYTKCVQNKVDEMLEITAISYSRNEEFKKLVEFRNERLMNAFKPRKVAAMLEFENVIESGEPLSQEQEPNEDNIQSTNE
ncbi:hypothetical protein Tco_0015425 [Tanacetum coccineum]